MREVVVRTVVGDIAVDIAAAAVVVVITVPLGLEIEVADTRVAAKVSDYAVAETP